VHGRTVTGQDDNGDFTFAPREQTCNLAVLVPSKEIPSSGGTAATMIATAGTPGTAATANGGGGLSTPAALLGNATLSIISGLPAQAGAPNPLAGRPYLLLPPECQKVTDSVKANAASAVRADGNGAGTLPGVPPGTYYLMISTRYNNQSLIWGQAVQLKPGANSVTLDQSNAVPIN
jgi:hypothetical protein